MFQSHGGATTLQNTMAAVGCSSSARPIAVAQPSGASQSSSVQASISPRASRRPSLRAAPLPRVRDCTYRSRGSDATGSSACLDSGPALWSTTISSKCGPWPASNDLTVRSNESGRSLVQTSAETISTGGPEYTSNESRLFVDRAASKARIQEILGKRGCDIEKQYSTDVGWRAVARFGDHGTARTSEARRRFVT